jgi:hypothetical protein
MSYIVSIISTSKFSLYQVRTWPRSIRRSSLYVLMQSKKQPDTKKNLAASDIRNDFWWVYEEKSDEQAYQILSCNNRYIYI